jgi:2-(1,2-epoxy-1,2-dihydrophenyl)acetyl-CoA isomerase
MNPKTIVLTREEGVATILLNRPDRLNSFTEEMLEEFSSAIDEVARDEKSRVLVITGAGRGFCAGADLDLRLFKVTSALEARQGMNLFNQIPIKLRALAKPVIACVNGVAAGAGANVALACDIIIASEQARFGQAFVNVGIHVDTGGTYLLPRAVGVPKALELMMTGDLIDAKEAWRIGMINKVVSAEELEKTTKELAQKLASGPPTALGMIKSSVYESLEGDLTSALEREADKQAVLLGSEDNKEGIRAFREKRKPVFKGR